MTKDALVLPKSSWLDRRTRIPEAALGMSAQLNLPIAIRDIDLTVEHQQTSKNAKTPPLVKCHRCGVEIGLFAIRRGEWAKKYKIKTGQWRDHSCIPEPKYSLTLEEWEVNGWVRTKVVRSTTEDSQFVELTSLIPELNARFKVSQSSPDWLEGQCIAKFADGGTDIIMIDCLDDQNRRLDCIVYGLLVRP
jgi:hypothetical protein